MQRGKADVRVVPCAGSRADVFASVPAAWQAQVLSDIFSVLGARRCEEIHLLDAVPLLSPQRQTLRLAAIARLIELLDLLNPCVELCLADLFFL